MKAKFVFWMTPRGEPYKKGDGRYVPTALLRKIGETARVDRNNEISWTGFDLYRFESAILSSAIIIQPNGRPLNTTDASKIMNDALLGEIRRNGTGKPILPGSLIQNANALAAAHFAKVPAKYILLSSLSVGSLPTKRIRIGDCELSPISRRGLARYRLPEALTKRTRDSFLITHSGSTEYQMVKVTTAGRSVAEATNKALDEVALLRGVWSLYATFGSWSFRMGNTTAKSMGIIHTGPIHTLHNLDGSPATDMFWFEPGYGPDREVFVPKNGWGALDKGRRWAMRRIRTLKYRDDMERLIRRFAMALDAYDADSAFLQMWSILEKITDTVGGRYEHTIRRITAIYDDKKIAKEMMEHLRTRRNQYVHAAVSDERRDDAAQMTKWFVEPHLTRLIANPFKVSSLKEYGRFLSLPRSVSALQARKQQMNRLLKHAILLHSSK